MASISPPVLRPVGQRVKVYKNGLFYRGAISGRTIDPDSNQITYYVELDRPDLYAGPGNSIDDIVMVHSSLVDHIDRPTRVFRPAVLHGNEARGPIMARDAETATGGRRRRRATRRRKIQRRRASKTRHRR
jgi:hypothetical protein